MEVNLQDRITEKDLPVLAAGSSRFLALVALFVGVGLIVVFVHGKRRAGAAECREHLRGMYAVLEQYEMEYGSLPSLAFYPDNPLADSDSLRVFVEERGLPGNSAVCPSSPHIVEAEGLSYLWNVNLNGKKLNGRRERRWMLVEVNALSSEVPPPHFSRYHILYTDGEVEAAARPPEEILAVRQ